MTPEVAAVQRRKDTLLLARNHLTRQLQTIEHPRHRTMIENALADVEQQLVEMGELDRAAGSR